MGTIQKTFKKNTNKERTRCKGYKKFGKTELHFDVSGRDKLQNKFIDEVKSSKQTLKVKFVDAQKEKKYLEQNQ